MFNIQEVLNYLIEKKREFVSDVRLRQSDEAILIYVRQEKVAARAKPGFTSKRQLSLLKKNVGEKFSRNVEIILLQDDTQQELESGFYQILNRKFNEKIVSLYISIRDEDIVDALIEVKEFTEDLQSEIADHFKSVLSDAELKLGYIQWLDSLADLPTIAAIFRSIKALQPVNVNTLTSEMQKSYRSVTDKWLNHKLDQYRKKGFVIRQKDGNYALTSTALKITPAGARRTSSDIERALALGNKKWLN